MRHQKVKEKSCFHVLSKELNTYCKIIMIQWQYVDELNFQTYSQLSLIIQIGKKITKIVDVLRLEPIDCANLICKIFKIKL